MEKMWNGLKKTAELDNVDAQYRLGVCYQRGLGIEQNSKQATKWFKKLPNKSHRHREKSKKRCKPKAGKHVWEHC